MNDWHSSNLFDQNANDYQRHFSDCYPSDMGARQKFILEMIKPDYNQWEGKEQYEIRFLKIVENNFQ